MLSATTASSATTGSVPPGTATAASSATESQDRFLKLLVAQLNNQDPMNPLDNAQMTSQMAQINTVTGIQQVNETLKSMAEQFASLQLMQGHTMVGREVLVAGNALVSNAGVASGAIDLAGTTDAVRVEILAPSGQVIDTFNLGSLAAGRHAFDWDASSYQGPGQPTFRVTAALGGKAVASTALSRDRIVSVGKENGAMTLQLQGRGAVSYGDIKAMF